MESNKNKHQQFYIKPQIIKIKPNKIYLSMDTISNYTQHQLNTSKSKQAFQFPKQKRFNYRTRFITETFYDIPTTKQTRTTTFGYGTKVSFTAKSQSPPPGSYNLGSSFQKDKSGVSFGKGRQQVKFGSFLSSSKDKKFLPSPDKYKLPNQLSKIGGKMFSRLPTQLDSLKKKKTPGPGTYDPKGVNLASSGSYILSHMKNMSSPRLHSMTMSFDKTQRKKNFSQLSPVTYDTVQKDKTKLFNSKYKSCLTRTFGREQRSGPEDKSKRYVPSFKYKRFSQFGTLI